MAKAKIDIDELEAAKEGEAGEGMDEIASTA